MREYVDQGKSCAECVHFDVCVKEYAGRIVEMEACSDYKPKCEFCRFSKVGPTRCYCNRLKIKMDYSGYCSESRTR